MVALICQNCISCPRCKLPPSSTFVCPAEVASFWICLLLLLHLCIVWAFFSFLYPCIFFLGLLDGQHSTFIGPPIFVYILAPGLVFFFHFSNKNVFLLDFWRFPLSWAFMDNPQPLSVLAAKEFLLNFILSSSFFLFFRPAQFKWWWWWGEYRALLSYTEFLAHTYHLYPIWWYMMMRRSRRAQGLAFSYKIPRTYILMWTNPLGANPDKTLEYILYLILD